MKEFTLGKSLTNVNNVISVFTYQETLGDTNEFTLGKSPINVNSVTSALLSYQT